MRLLPLVLLLSGVALAQEPSAPALPWTSTPDVISSYIREAAIDRLEVIPVGVTKPMRAVLKPGGPIESVVVKELPPGRKGGFWESYKSEIAAYELDRMLDLNMVPPTVEKRVKGTLMSAQMFVDRCVWLKELKGLQSPDVAAWNRQVHRHRVFDNLIANVDRNAGNLLVYRSGDAGHWQLVLVDHSRCFTTTTRMIFPMTKIDRPLFERLKALDRAALDARLGGLLAFGADALLKRRDAIVRHFEQLAAQKGEAQVFTP
jgi:hypothetical protein